jgi:5'-methylthioadenosine phosphorylase
VLIPIGDHLADVGVFGGSGFYEFKAGEIVDADHVQDVEVEVDTPYGPPAGPITVVTVADRRVAFLPRHGRGHRFAAHRVPFRANVWALASLGVRSIVAPCSAGALQPELGPGDFVVVDQLVDRTWGRRDTFHDVGGDEHQGAGVHHQPFADPYDAAVRAVLVEAGAAVGAPVRDGGTMVVINGPRFSTRAESLWFRSMGWDVVNMTGYPEAVLAAEAGIPYATIALVTDRDAGVDGGAAVTMEAVFATMQQNVARVRELLTAAFPNLP